MSVKKKLIVIVVLLVLAILSRTIVADIATSPKTYEKTYETLDDKKMTALGLTASVTVTSTAIAAIIGDATTPIAEKIAGMTTPLMFIVCAIYLEKFLLTTLGYVSFKILIPCACILYAIYILFQKELFEILAYKLGVFAIVISLVIPASVKMTDLIEETFNESINSTYEKVNEISNEAEKAQEEDTSAFERFLNKLDEKTTELGDGAKNAMSHFIDAIAVLLITTCIIPIAVIFFFLWIIKLLFGGNVDLMSLSKLGKNKKEAR